MKKVQNNFDVPSVKSNQIFKFVSFSNLVTNVALHISTKFHQNRITFTKVIMLTNTCIMYIHIFKRIVF